VTSQFLVVLQEPQDLVNIALVVRAMKNMGLSRLRLVRPVEFDAYRIEGIAHDTEDVVRRAEMFDDLPSAVADAKLVVGTSARRRSSKRRWLLASEAGSWLADSSHEVGVTALVFGPEHRGLSNQELDLCEAVIHVPTNPEHTSLNLGHAALIVFYELRKAMVSRGALENPDLGQKGRARVPAASSEELERLFSLWQEAMEVIGFFTGLDPAPKMRSFRAVFQRAELDRRELGLLEAAAFEIIHYERRLRERLPEHGSQG
jgi:TrmH family RNA methyltransferase